MPPDSATPPAGYVPYQPQVHDTPWPEIDRALLDELRRVVPPFPLHLLPSAWACWVAETAQAAGTPTDYVAQGLLASVAAVCGAGVQARVTPSWHELLVRRGRRWSARRRAASRRRWPPRAASSEQIETLERGPATCSARRATTPPSRKRKP